MGRITLAFTTFFRILFQAETAERIRKLESSEESVSGKSEPASVPQAPPKPVPTKIESQRSDALSLLETLQREARLIDFLEENLDGYSDQQVGAAVREVHRQSRAVLQRMFQLVPAVENSEGSRMTVTGEEDAATIRLVGNVSDARPVEGTLVHPGWKAEKCDLPKWNGSPSAKMVLAPAEVEVN